MRQFVVACTFIAFVFAAQAGEVAQKPDGTSVWQAGIDGVEIEWAPDGAFNRIYSRFSQPVGIADRRAISKAQMIAEEKAKAAIVRFLDQKVTSSRLVTEVQNDIEQTTRTKGTNEQDTTNKTNKRQMVETLTEVTASFAAGSLRGVIVLERGYDEKDEVAWVSVGISKKTMGSAADLQKALEKPEQPAAESGQKQRTQATPGSEVQTTKTQSW